VEEGVQMNDVSERLKSVGAEYDGERVAGERSCGEDIDDLVRKVAHGSEPSDVRGVADRPIP
jgi:hypothetical protein